jgi:hypothetical protein
MIIVRRVDPVPHEGGGTLTLQFAHEPRYVGGNQASDPVALPRRDPAPGSVRLLVADTVRTPDNPLLQRTPNTDPTADDRAATPAGQPDQPPEPAPATTSSAHLPEPRKHHFRIIAKAQVDYRHTWHSRADYGTLPPLMVPDRSMTSRTGS